jgi:hypothetical protein
VPSTVLSQFWKGKKQNVPHTSKLENNFWRGRISKFHAGAGIKQNQCLLPFPRTTKMNVLGYHYFAQKHPETAIPLMSEIFKERKRNLDSISPQGEG